MTLTDRVKMKQRKPRDSVASSKLCMGTGSIKSAGIIHLLLAALFGLYLGINLSGFFSLSDTSLAFLGPHTAFDTTATANDDRITSMKIKQKLEEAQTLINSLKAETEKLTNDKLSSSREIEQLKKSCENEHENETETKTIARRNQQLTKDRKDSSSPTVAAAAAATTTSSNISSQKQNVHPFCQSILPHPAPTAMALWNEHIVKILEASRVQYDRRFMFHDFTTQLLQIISPRLQRSVKTTPNDWKPVGACLKVVWERYKYLQMTEKERRAIPVHERPRPLKLLIMGGSLLVGTNCRNLMRELNFQFQLPKRECNWSHRLGQFLNLLFLGENLKPNELLVEVTKVAMGGTNTATGSVIWQYDLIPEQARDPDIVINAYSTNDMHILTVLEAESSNTTLRDRTFEMIQDFVRKILETKRCRKHYHGDDVSEEPIPPLLLHMDDYLGNEQRKIWETTELTQGAQVLANYYGFVTMSYADTVREFVYGDSYEKWFSSEWFVEEKRKGTFTFERQIHPGMGAHISSMWVTAYNLLQLASVYCSMPDPNGTKNISNYEPGLWNLPELKKQYKQPVGKPKQQPNGLPPVLSKDLLLEDITKLWRRRAANDNQKLRHPDKICNNVNTLHGIKQRKNLPSLQVKCPFSWVSGLSLQQNNVTWIQEYFQTQSSAWEGWKLSEDGGKIGFIPSTITTATPAYGKNSSHSLVLEFLYSQTIRSVTFFFMKSYGKKWLNSALEAKVWSSTHQLLEERRMIGTHDKNTSEMYTEEIILNDPVNSGEMFRIEAKLVGGDTFKIMGLAVCS